MIHTEQTVADLVTEHSECAAVFQKHRIDFCCHGQRSIEQACGEADIPLDALVDELQHAIEGRLARGPDARTLSTPALVAQIIATHHAYLRENLPFVQGLAQKVSRVHGDHNPRLRELEQVVDGLVADIHPHLDSEEQELFPLLMSREPDPVAVRDQLNAMHAEHLEVGALLGRMRDATEDYALPEWACNSYRTLFAELARLESDILAHVHLENHVLMPRFVEQEPLA